MTPSGFQLLRRKFPDKAGEQLGGCCEEDFDQLVAAEVVRGSWVLVVFPEWNQ